MTSMMQSEIEDNGFADLDISRVKKTNEINENHDSILEKEQLAEQNISFSTKVNEFEQNSSY